MNLDTSGDNSAEKRIKLTIADISNQKVHRILFFISPDIYSCNSCMMHYYDWLCLFDQSNSSIDNI